MKAKTLDFRNANPYNPLAYLEAVRDELKRDGLYKEGLLYRGFSGKDINTLIREGQDTSGELFCVRESELETALKTGDNIANVFSYAKEHENPALVVYDGSKMTQETRFVYRLPEKNKSEAIVAVYRLKNFLKPKKAKRANATPEQGRIALKELKERYGIECRRRIRAKSTTQHPKQKYFPFMHR